MQNLKINLPDNVNFILNAISNNDGLGFVVGGAVRDGLLGIEPKDYDISTDLTVSQIKDIFEDYIIDSPVGEKFGTVIIIMDGEKYDISTFRKSYIIEDGKTVGYEHSLKLEDDLALRDFTINAMAYNNEFGLIDLFGGQKDLENKTLRFVGDAISKIKSDPARLLRAVRFYSSMNFIINPEDEKLLHNSSLINLLDKVSLQRLRHDFEGILLGTNVFDALMKYPELVFKMIPELKDAYKFEQNSKYHTHDVYEHTCYVVKDTEPNLIHRYSALLHDVGKPSCYTEKYDEQDKRFYGHFYGHAEKSGEMVEPILKRFNYGKYFINEVEFVVTYHDFEIVERRSCVEKLIKKIENVPYADISEFLEAFLDVRGADRKDHINLKPFVSLEYVRNEYDTIMSERNSLKITDLKVDGNIIKELGFKGKEIGTVLKHILSLVVGEKISNNKTEIIDYIEKNKNNILQDANDEPENQKENTTEY